MTTLRTRVATAVFELREEWAFHTNKARQLNEKLELIEELHGKLEDSKERLWDGR